MREHNELFLDRYENKFLMSIIGGAPGGMGGPGSGNPNSTGKAGGNKGGLGGLGKVGPYKKSKRKPVGREEVNQTTTIQTNEMTAENALRIGGIALGALGGPVGTLLNAGANAVAGTNPFGFEKPTGTTDQFSSDPKQAEGAQTPVVVQPKVNKKKKPLLPVGLQLLAGMPGSLLGT